MYCRPHGLRLRLLAPLALALAGAACSGATSSTPPASAAQPSPAVLSPSAVSSVTPAPTAATPAPAGSIDGQAVIAKMGQILSADTATYRIAATAHVDFGTVFDYDMKFAIAGPDVSVDSTTKMEGNSVTTHVVKKGTAVYTSLDGKTWQQGDGTSLGDMKNSWSFLVSPDSYALKGIDTNTGALMFEGTKPLAYPVAGNASYTFGGVQMSNVVLLVKSDGTPISVRGDLTGTATNKDGQTKNITGYVMYAFSDVGATIVIAAPK